MVIIKCLYPQLIIKNIKFKNLKELKKMKLLKKKLASKYKIYLCLQDLIQLLILIKLKMIIIILKNIHMILNILS
jgi:hypothetical protein